MTTAYTLTFVLAAASVFVYHVLQKLTPTHVNPILALALTYLIALASTLALLPLFPYKGTLVSELRAITWHSYALGVAVLGIELGFLLAYRAGWNAGLAALAVNAIAAIALLGFSIVALSQGVNAKQVMGFFVCLGGLWLIMT